MTVAPPPQRTDRRALVSWALWDWGSAAFNAVIVTFVYSVYLTDAVGDDLPGDITANTWLGWSLGLAGFFIAVLAPVTGQRADAGGRRKLSLGMELLLLMCSWLLSDLRGLLLLMLRLLLLLLPLLLPLLLLLLNLLLLGMLLLLLLRLLLA